MLIVITKPRINETTAQNDFLGSLPLYIRSNPFFKSQHKAF
jgi:hypothetical protein